MPYQNRVAPDGALVAAPERGTLMGNRGCLHDARQQIARAYQARRWIYCLLEFKGRRRPIMRPGRYTELFFLDEATALAAGHRPCAECQRERFAEFRQHWAAANPDLAGGALPRVDTIDAALQRERISEHRLQRHKVKRTYAEQLGGLPDGTLVALGPGHAAYLVRGDAIYPWSFAGYGAPLPRPDRTVAQVLTPRSIVHALAHGFGPAVHASARLWE